MARCRSILHFVPINYQKLVNWRIPEVEQHLTRRDTMLYALGVGLGADPAYAQKAGYPMPILHGRCTFGVAGHAILKTLCGYDPARFTAMEGRFSSPVYPGETIRTEMWQDGNVVSFRSTVPARGVTVLDNGRAKIQ